VLAGFLVSFGFIRVSARLGRSPRVPWWPGSVVSDSGVHLHHLVWGICLMLAAGTLGFALFQRSPGLEICAALFGVGAGFTVDEFALWVYLDDVYWAKEGRASIDAAVIAATLMLLALLGAQPFEVRGGSTSQIVVELSVAALVLALAAICFAKQRVMHGVLGLFFFPIAMYGASRIGKPRSPWARRFYRSSRKVEKAERRFRAGRRTDRFKEWFRDAIGGETDAVYQARLAERTASGDAAAAVRERAERASG
jgi:hypothetical protein